jgi:anhydro-N-acetylmuramic acid kinase
MTKQLISLGLMSGTSGDGVDVSIIQSDGEAKYKPLFDRYFEYDDKIFRKIHDLKPKINNSKKLSLYSADIDKLENEITLFHSKIVNKVQKIFKNNIDIIGFHGQTMFHSPKEKISTQLGDGKLLSQITKKTVIYHFRQKDLEGGGEGAPLTPIFHKLLEKNFDLKPVSFLNIGGITNRTTILNNNTMTASDIGPGMCLIDKWIRVNSKNTYDEGGAIAESGKVNKIILEQALEFFFYNQNKENSIKKKKNIKSFDVNDFDLSFVRGLSLEDGAATLTAYTAEIINSDLVSILKLDSQNKLILCGGGRKNKFLIKKININKASLKLIDEYGIDGDFVESQAFAYLAIRSYQKKPISFPETTGVRKECLGGEVVEFK